MFYSQLIIQSDLSKMGEVDAFLEGIMLHFGIKEDFLGVLSLPLIECVKNGIVHGNKMDKNKTVAVDFQVKESKLSFTVTDEGQGFDYENFMKNCGETVGKNGLFVLNKLAEEVTFLKNGSQISYKIDVPFSINSPANRTAILQQKANKEEKIQVNLQYL
ncbi:MAG: ATP-binding protein [Lentimicrobiaceae bacterium]|nr:ATP-binding protein [Lentimicrobiaceae bacterium]